MKLALSRILAATISLFLLMSFTACQRADTNKEATTTESVATTADTMTEEDYKACSIANESTFYPDAPPILTFKNASGETVGEVLNDEFQYYQSLYKENFDGGDASFWEDNPDMVTRVESLIWAELCRNYAVRYECEKYGIGFSDEELLELDRSLAELVYTLGGKDAFAQTLTLYHMTPYLYYTQTQTEKLYEKLNTYYLESGMILTSNEDVRALLDTDEYVRAKHILIMNDAGDDHEANLATAKDLLARLQNGEDFDQLMKEHSEDVNTEGALNGPDGYYFFRGEMDESFENASFALKEGELSDIVTSAYGYHIILRLEKEAEYMDANLSSIKSAYAQLRFYQLLDEVVTDWETLPCESYADYADPVFTGTSGKAAS